jgi:hypothetical protein
LTENALDNITKTVKALSVGHIFIRHDPDLMKAFYRHFLLKAGEFCSVCNTGIKSTLYRVAKSFKIKLIVSGQSNRTEAQSPNEFFSCSSGYFYNVAKSAFSKKEINSFVYISQLGRAISHIQQSPFYLQLPSYIPWKEEEFINKIKSNLNWEGAFKEQHVDCRMSDAKEYLHLKKHKVIELTAKLSSLIRDKQLSRDEALSLSQQRVLWLEKNEYAIREQIKEECNLSEEQLDKAIQASHLPYISKANTLLSKAKNSYETFNYRKIK